MPEVRAGFRLIAVCNMHWHHKMAKVREGVDRTAARNWLVEKIRRYEIRFLLADLNMSAYVLVDELRACGIECNLMASHCELAASCDHLLFDSAVIIAIGGPRYELKPNTIESHIKMAAQHPLRGAARGYPAESYLEPLYETWQNSL